MMFFSMAYNIYDCFDYDKNWNDKKYCFSVSVVHKIYVKINNVTYMNMIWIWIVLNYYQTLLLNGMILKEWNCETLKLIQLGWLIIYLPVGDIKADMNP